MKNSRASSEVWPKLNYADWKETCATLHMWTQIVGKIRLVKTPWTNHSWHVTLYLTARGLTTSPIPHGTDIFEIRFDFIDHQLRILKSDGAQNLIELKPRSVADFYKAVMAALEELKLPLKIDILPNEIPDPIPFDRDDKHCSYDREYANRFWCVLARADRVFKNFRSRFCGKCSPVHFFWGSFDLAVTRFSGRTAPPHPGGIPHLPDAITREAYSQEVSSLGFWPGNDAMPQAIFYSYAYPEPKGFAEAKVKPAAAGYNSQFKEFILPYDAVRSSKSPDDAILDFAQSAYDAASILGKWDRAALEEKKPALHSTSKHS
ncbi:MAG TPA: DUF5996 family protein [Chthoniobacterales bacterium]|jgi:hypothetical protein|nr:DUF5996 family protein [Chthoniobacterales bacterium]